MGTSQAKPFTGTERFEIRRRLGAGGMGVVYEVYDRERDSVVALKTLRRVAPESLYRFKHEFRALAGIAHPNLVGLHELFIDDETWFFTMELLDGVDFLAHVRGNAAPPPAARAADPPGAGGGAVDTVSVHTPGRTREVDEHRLRAALAQLALGIQALHEAGRLHRDIKPSNVIVTTESRVALVDFGVIAEIGGPRARGLGDHDIVGTPAYAAPEQARGEAVPASDWYAVGVILFEALTGRRPFTGSARAVLYDKQRIEPAPVHSVAPGAPSDLADLCARLLRRDPDDRATSEEVLRTLDVPSRRTRRTSVAGDDTDARLIGREMQLDRLRRAFDDAQAGVGSVVHIHGESGMGKSALVWSFLRELEADGAVVLAGRCYEQESVPYKAVDPLVDALSQLLDGLPRHQADALLPRDILMLARIFPVLMRVEAVAQARRRKLPDPEPRELRRRAFGALRELVARVAEVHPLVLFIDDLQWGDVDSAPLLDGLMRPPDQPAIVLLLAYRSEDRDRSPLLRALLRRRERLGPAARTTDIGVGPLEPEDAERLATGLLVGRDADPALAPAIAREAGGVPLFVQELARAARDPRATALDGEAPTLERLLAARIGELPREAALLVELVALAAKPIAQRVLRVASRLDEALYLRALQQLSSAHLIRQSGAGDDDLVEAYHDRVRVAVAANVAAERRRDLHLRLATALGASETPDLEAMAAHYEAAGDDERASELARRGAAQAEAALAFDRAAALYRRALALGDEDRGLRARLGDALTNAGRGAEAAEAYLAASRGAAEADSLELRRRAASQYLRCGHLERGNRVLDEVLREVGFSLPGTPRRALLSLLWNRLRLRLRGLSYETTDVTRLSPYELARLDVCWSASTDLGLVDNVIGADFGTRQLLLALDLGEPYRVARGLVCEAMFSASRGGALRKRTERICEQAGALAAELGDAEVSAWLMAARGLFAYQRGLFRPAAESSEDCVRTLREQCVGVMWETSGGEVQVLWALFYLGELREICERVDALREQARERGNRFDEANLCTGLPAIAWLVQDRPDEGRGAIDHVMSHWSPRGFHLQHYFELLARAHCDLYQGRADDAVERIAATWPALRRSKLLMLPSVAIEGRHLRARAALAAGGSRAAAVARKDARRIRRHRTPWADAVAALIAAGIEGTPDALSRAAATCDDAEMAVFAAAARRRSAERDDAPDAARQVDAADEQMRRQQIRDPARFAALLVPVLERSRP